MFHIEEASVPKFFNSLNELDVKFEEYLTSDGKWLVGGFQDLFSKKTVANSNSIEFNLKSEVFMQLPREIRIELEKLLSVVN